MKKGHHWVVRDGNRKDMEEILSLRKIVFGEMEKDKLNPEFWKWEFVGGPDGKAFIYIVEEGGKVIGHFADIPKRFSIQGKVVLGTLSLDLMVHPDYRRRGIFEEMGRYGAQRVKQENGLLMIAFPIRKKTIVGLRKIGWRDVVALPVLVYPLKFWGIFDRYLHFSLLSHLLGGIAHVLHLLLFSGWRGKDRGEGMVMDSVGRLDDEFDRFWERVSSIYPILGVRDQAFFNWRYFQHPTRSYTIYRMMKNQEMKGYVVLRRVDLLQFNSAVIVDLLALDEEALSALVEKGIQHCRQEGADLLGFMVPRTHPYYKKLIRVGFLPSLKSFQFMIYDHGKEDALQDPKGWYVNWGDTDVI